MKRPEDWTDKKGNKFKANASAILGPFALFLTNTKGGKRVLLSELTDADAVRFYHGVADRPERAARWVNATSEGTRQLFNRVRVLDGETYFTPKFDEMPEPEFLILFFGQYTSGRAWEAAREFIPEYNRVKARFPGISEAVFLGVRNKESEHDHMARDLKIPFLIEDWRRKDEMRFFHVYGPKEGARILIMTRDGVPIAMSDCKTKSDIERAVLEMEALLNFMRPGNQRTWPDRTSFYRTVRLASFASGKADPFLVGHLLELGALRLAGIKNVSATLKVAADGQVTSASVHPGEGITPEVGSSLSGVLQKSAFVPAIENGKFVDGTYELRLEP